MSTVKKRRMVYLDFEIKPSKMSGESSVIYHQTSSTPALKDENLANEEPEILYNFDSDEELNDNPLKFSRSPSPASSTHSSKCDNDIFQLKDDLQRIANDPATCSKTMTTILQALHNYFPWVPDNSSALKYKSYDEPEPPERSLSINRNTVKTEPPSSTNVDSINYVMIQQKELDGIKTSIDVIREGQIELLKEFKNFRKYRPFTRPMNVEDSKFELPHSNLEEFLKFDKELLTDPETKNQLIKIYMSEMEFDPQKYIKKNLRKLFTVDLALKFSFRGRQGNMCAAEFNTIKILRDCTGEQYGQSCKDLFDRCATSYFYYVKDKITKAQKNVLKRNIPKSDVNTIEFVLPFNDIKSFKSFDVSLVKDPELTHQLKLMYLEEKVVEYKRFLLNNFKKLFTDELAVTFSFTDKLGDVCIRDFNVIKIMKECMMEKYKELNENSFYNCGKQYLSYVKHKVLDTKKN